MKALPRSARSGASSVNTDGVGSDADQSPQSRIQPGLPSQWVARLRDLELRLVRLEAENRELREACREREASGVNHANLHDLAPIGLVTLEVQGTILEVNRTGAALLGRDKLSLLGRRFTLLVAPEDISEFTMSLRRCLRSRQMVSGELSLRKPEGGLVVVQFAIMPVLDGGSRVIQVETTLVDITDRKRTEKALRESEARLKAIMDNSPAMIFLKDTQGRYLHFNRQFEKVFHLTLEQAVGKTDAEIFPLEQAATFCANDRTVLKAGVPMEFDEIAVYDDGPHTSIVTRFPLQDGDGKIYGVAGIVTDITERRRLEAEVLQISEREQRRIAQDLHDGLGQHLTGVVHLAAVLQARLAERSLPEAAEAARIVKLLDDSVAQTRTLARGLHPVQLESHGLMSALEQLAAIVRDMFKIDCRLECSRPVLILDNVMATHLYRIAQEATNNAIKHGRASQIRIGLAESLRKITLTVRNNGVAMLDNRAAKDGIGLRIMQHRATMIGGSLVFISDMRRGTTLVCIVPPPGSALEPLPSNEH